jgi:hypothetical protein
MAHDRDDRERQLGRGDEDVNVPTINGTGPTTVAAGPDTIPRESV